MWFSVLVLSLCLAYAWGDQVCCSYGGCFNNNEPFKHLPLPDCPNTIPPVFNLFTRSNRNSAQKLTRNSIPNAFSGNKMTIFLVHGWTGGPSNDWLINVKNALLDKADVNAVIVGWKEGAGYALYQKSASNTRSIGAELGMVMANLKNNGGSAASRLYCVGHSLGSHLCGHAGRWTSIGRITGLDPAGPLFDSYSLDNSLNSKCASFVDVIHTHGKDGAIRYGTMRVLGHMDFYPNGAGFQPGCGNNRRRRDIQDGELVFPQGDLGCSHSRAHDYYLQSVKSNCFISRSKCTNNNNIPGSCSNCGNNCAVMGYGARGSGSNGLYYLTTTSSKPFCQN